MTLAPVEQKPAETESAKPGETEAPRGTDTQPPNGAPQTADGDKGEQQQPPQQAAPRTEQAPAPSQEQPKTQPQQPPPLTEAQLRQKIADDDAEQKRQAELKELFPNTVNTVKGALKKLAEREGFTLQLDDDKEIIDAIQNLNLKGKDAHGLEARQTFDSFRKQLSDGFYDAIPEDKHEEFTKRVQGKPPAEWAAAIRDLSQPDQKAALADLFAPHFQEGEQREGFTKAVTEAKTPADAAKAIYEQIFTIGDKAPPGTPRISGGRPAANGTFSTLAELSAAREAKTDGLTDEQFIKEQDRLLKLGS